MGFKGDSRTGGLNAGFENGGEGVLGLSIFLDRGGGGGGGRGGGGPKAGVACCM